MLIGGSRQLSEVVGDVVSSAPAKSHLAERLLLLFGWGLVSAPTIQWLAEGAVLDGVEHARVKDLASLGSSGAHKKNCRRDLFRKFCANVQVPRAISLSVPILGKDLKPFWNTASIVSLPALVDVLYRKHTGVFDAIFGTNPREFWDQVSASDPKMLHLRSMTEVVGWKDKLYPYILHGDAGQYIQKTKDSLMCAQIKGLLGTRFNFNILPLFCMPKACKAYIDDGVMQQDLFGRLWKQSVAFLNDMFWGVWPTSDIDGRDFSGDNPFVGDGGSPPCRGEARFVLWGVTGDLEFLSNDLGVAHFNSNEPCWHCPISRSPESGHCLTDLRMDAPWKRARLDPTVRLSPHVVFDIYGCTRHHVVGDLMHSGYLGQVQFMLGGTLYELIHDGPFAGVKDDRIAALWRRICDWYGVLVSPTRLGNLKESMFTCKNGFHVLSSKAAEAGDLLIVMVSLAGELSSGSPRDLHRLAALKSLATVFRVFKDGGFCRTLRSHWQNVLMTSTWYIING